jgi:penicillin amidase
VLLALLLLAAGYLLLRASLPQLEGTVRAAALAAPVSVTRDARGVPTLSAGNRTDLAWATGFVHAQDRFFEMDLSRRVAAGELAELVGAAALEHDRNVRLFRFRHVAQAVLAEATPEQRALLQSYTEGVNAGLAALRARPWEYWLLGAPPRTWQVEDSILVVYAMWWDLQANGLRRQILREQINARLGGPACAGGWKCAMQFLYPARTDWDAPVDAPPGPAVVAVPVPAPEVLNVRGAAAATRTPPAPALLGSNNWAVAGSLTASGSALVANDMHLAQRVPTIWYHARLRVPGALDLNGVTLPGTPLLVAGSNGRIAWGFTNSYGDWVSVARRECSGVDEQGMQTPEGVVPLTRVREEIRVHGAAAQSEAVFSGPAGVLLRIDAATHECWFGSWIAQVPQATNMNLLALESAGSVAEALQLAPEIGIPGQNAVIGDHEGHIGWALFARLPQDTRPERTRGDGPWTRPAEHPHLLDPPNGRLWSANARVSSDARALELIGGELASLGAEYDLGARAGQIRDDLLALQGGVTASDMLRIQLDDRAVFLARWQALLLRVLDERAVAERPQRAELRRLIATWDARAAVGSVGYRLVRSYREQVQGAVWGSILGALGITPVPDSWPPAQFEGPLWTLVTQQPLHLLARPYASWDEFLLAQADATLAALAPSCAQLARCTWGARNLVRIRHPLSAALPALAAFLDMPTLELAGDHNMPRVQEGAVGASERFAVSPGHEAQGYLELPGGQSGHPLSPYYRAGFMGWARGEALPLLPGPVQHTLALTPR